jgi:hypothetical protein
MLQVKQLAAAHCMSLHARQTQHQHHLSSFSQEQPAHVARHTPNWHLAELPTPWKRENGPRLVGKAKATLEA